METEELEFEARKTALRWALDYPRCSITQSVTIEQRAEQFRRYLMGECKVMVLSEGNISIDPGADGSMLTLLPCRITVANGNLHRLEIANSDLHIAGMGDRMRVMRREIADRDRTPNWPIPEQSVDAAAQ